MIIRSHKGPNVWTGQDKFGDMLSGYTLDHVGELGKLYTLFNAPDYPQVGFLALGCISECLCFKRNLFYKLIVSLTCMLDKLVNDPTEGNAWHADHIIHVYRGGGTLSSHGTISLDFDMLKYAPKKEIIIICWTILGHGKVPIILL